MNENDYYPDINEKIYPEPEVNNAFSVDTDVSRKGKIAKLESIANPDKVYYAQFHFYHDTMPARALFGNITSGNYYLSVEGEDRKVPVTVFYNAITDFQWW